MSKKSSSKYFESGFCKLFCSRGSSVKETSAKTKDPSSVVTKAVTSTEKQPARSAVVLPVAKIEPESLGYAHDTVSLTLDSVNEKVSRAAQEIPLDIIFSDASKKVDQSASFPVQENQSTATKHSSLVEKQPEFSAIEETHTGHHDALTMDVDPSKSEATSSPVLDLDFELNAETMGIDDIIQTASGAMEECEDPSTVTTETSSPAAVLDEILTTTFKDTYDSVSHDQEPLKHGEEAPSGCITDETTDIKRQPSSASTEDKSPTTTKPLDETIPPSELPKSRGVFGCCYPYEKGAEPEIVEQVVA